VLPIHDHVGFLSVRWNFRFSVGVWRLHDALHIERFKGHVVGRIGSQPIALAAAALVILVSGSDLIVLWRAYTGTSPEQDRIASARQLAGAGPPRPPSS